MKFFDLYDVFNAYYTEDIQNSLEEIKKECKGDLYEKIEPELKSAKELETDYEYNGVPMTIVETEHYWLVDIRTGLGFGQYPKDSFTLEEAVNDQTSDEY